MRKQGERGKKKREIKGCDEETRQPLGRDVGLTPGTSPEDLQEEIKS